MKKIIKSIVVITFLILLSGCTTSKNQDDKASSSRDVNKKLSEDCKLQISNIYTGTTAAQVNSGAFVLDINADDSYNIKFIDYDEKIMTFLCSAISCTHSSENCSSWVAPSVGGCDIVTDENYLYLFLRGSSVAENPPTVYRMGFNGFDKTKLCEFGANQTISLPAVMDKTNLYISISSTGLIDSKVMTQSGIISINKTTGKTSVIYDYKGGANFILGVDEKNIIMKKIEGNLHSIYYIDTSGNEYKSSVNYKTDEKIELISDKILYLNLTTKKIESIKDDGSFQEETEAIDIEINPEFVFVKDVYSDNAIIETVIINDEHPTGKYKTYLINTKSGIAKEIVYEYDLFGQKKPMNILLNSENIFLLLSGFEFGQAQIQDQNGDIATVETVKDQYAIVARNDYETNRYKLSKIKSLE